MAAIDDKFERLMNLTAALLDAERPLSAEYIHEHVAGYTSDGESYRRAFERDKVDLLELGIPIVLQEIPGEAPGTKGYRIERTDYELPDPELDPEELAALHLALRAVRVGESDSLGTRALWRLGGVLGNEDESSGESAFTLGALPTDPALVPLFGAVLERRVATFVYGTNEGEATRSLEPWRLEFQRGHWYVLGFDIDRQGERNFRIDRIVGPIEAGPAGAFAPSSDTRGERPFRPWNPDGSGDQPVTAILRVDGEHAATATELLGTETISSVEIDGATIYEVPVTSWPAFRSFVLSFLDHAELIGPPQLRSDLVDWLQDMNNEGGES
jgi:proteasome accessory factor B